MASRNEIISTKLCPPEPRTNDIKRCLLPEQINSDRRPRLVALRAPAGYGKSAFVVQLVRSWGIPAVWYHLDREDDHVSVFSTYLVSGIAAHLPGLLDSVSSPLESTKFSESDTSNIVALLVNALCSADSPGIAVVLEDCHHIRNGSVRLLIQELVAHAPSPVSFVLTSRNQLPLHTSKYQAALEAAVLGIDDLRFRDSEVASLLSSTVDGLDPDLIAAVCREYEGWPALVRLVASDRRALHMVRLGELPQAVSDYLQSEVVSCHPEPARRFMKATSILDFLTPELCDAFLETDDSVHILRSLRDEQLLIPTQSDFGPAFRYPNPLRRFLQSALGGERRAFLVRAGECERLMGRMCRAVDHFLQAGAAEQAVSAIKETGDELVKSGKYDLLSRWIDLLPAEMVRADPWMSMWRGLVQTPRGQLDVAQIYLENALDLFRRRGDRGGMAQARLGLADILISRGKCDQSQVFAEKALSAVMQHRRDLVPEALAQRALILAVHGQMDKAISTASEAMKSAQLSGDQDVMVGVAADLSRVYHLCGDYGAVMHMRRTAFPGGADGQPAGSAQRVAFSRAEAFSVGLRDIGELHEAMDHARRSLDYKNRYGLTERLPSAYWQLATACVDRGEFGRAEECFSRAMDIAETTGGERFSVALCLSGLARLRYLQGRVVEGQALVDQGLEVARSLHEARYFETVCSMTALMHRLLTGDFSAALSMALDVESVSAEMGARYVAAVNQGLLASIYAAMSNRNAALEHASRCLSACARGHYVQELITFFGIFATVLRTGLELGIEVDFVQRILTRAGQPALNLLAEMTAHPDPQVRQRAEMSLASVQTAGAELDTDKTAGAGVSRILHPGSETKTAAIMSPSDAFLVSIRDDYYRINIQCFGSFRVYAGDHEILAHEWRTTKARDLLAYLVHRKEPVQSDVILEDLWPGSEYDQTRAVLHTNLYYLRRALNAITGGLEVVVFGGGFYRLADGCYLTDVDRFMTLLSSALSGDGVTVISAELLEKAIALYKGDYLEGMDYAWVGAEQRRLKRVCQEARERLVNHYLRSDNCSRALPHALALAEACPLSEDAHALTMKVYSRIGDLAAVKEQYKLMSELFDEELGARPSQELRRLYYSLCTGKQ